jgi:hypothetical protein
VGNCSRPEVTLLESQTGANTSLLVEEVRVGVVTVDQENFGNVSAARTAFDIDDDVKGIRDVCLDGSERQLDAAKHNW